MSSEEQCPTAGGLGENGFNPDFDLKQLVLDPSANMHIWGWLASGFLTLATITISTHTIKMHLMHYYTLEIQRHKVRVLAYPAFYALFAWLSYLKYKYETVIMFCAKLFESFAVYNLYMCLQSYLKPYRERYAGQKIPITTKVLGILKVHLNSKWGLHFRVICDISVFQFPVWNIISSLISIITQVNGVYCDGQFKFNGAYVYLAVINFASLTLILTALFTYLAVFNEEWHHGHIKAHGMFWCVKGPIMVIFYFGDILLSALSFFNVITDSPAKHSGGTYWPAAAIKNGYYVLLICAVMIVVAIMMDYFFGLDAKEYAFEEDDLSSGWAEYLAAFADAFLAFIPQFFRNLLLCGGDTVVLARKRMRLRKERRLSEEERNLLMPDNDIDSAQALIDSYPMPSQLPPALRQRRTSFDEGEDSYIRTASTTAAAFFKDPASKYAGDISLTDIHAASSSSRLMSETKEGDVNDKGSVPAGVHKDASDNDSNGNANILDTPSVPGLALPPPPPPPRQSRLLSHNDQVAEAATSGSSYFTPHDPQPNNRSQNYF